MRFFAVATDALLVDRHSAIGVDGLECETLALRWHCLRCEAGGR